MRRAWWVATIRARWEAATRYLHRAYVGPYPLYWSGLLQKGKEHADAVRFLCGPEASWVTGVSLSVDGGHHLRRGPNYEPFIRALYGDDLAEGRL